MSVYPSPKRTVAVGLTVLLALQPVVCVSGATGKTAELSGNPPNATVSVPAAADPGDTSDRVGIAAGSTGSFASLPEDASPPTAASRSAPELGQGATPTSTPSPAPSPTPGTTGPDPDPVLVLSGLIVVVLLALGVWFLLR